MAAVGQALWVSKERVSWKTSLLSHSLTHTRAQAYAFIRSMYRISRIILIGSEKLRENKEREERMVRGMMTETCLSEGSS